MYTTLFGFFVGLLDLMFSLDYVDFVIVLIAPVVLSVLYFFIKFIAKRA